MNIDNIRKTIESLKASNTFDQSDYINDCGTPACIAGHAAVDAGYTSLKPMSGLCSNSKGELYHVSNVAADWFDMDLAYLDDELFYEDVLDRKVTKEDAIAVLENLIETGEVDWSICNART